MNKKHLFWIFLLLIITTIYFYQYLKPNMMPFAGNDFNDQHLGQHYLLKESVTKYNDWNPLWNPYVLSGTPYLSKAHTASFLYPLNLLVLIIPSVITAAKLIFFLNFFIAGIGMYCLVYYLIKRRDAAFISALIYMFNGFSLMLLEKGWSEYIRAFSLAPFIFLCIILAFKNKSWCKYAIGAGVLFSLQIFAGGPQIFLWTMFMVGCFFIFKLLGKNFKKRLFKTAMIAGVVLLVFFAFGAVRLLPAQEQLTQSRRAGGVFYEEAMLWQKLDLICNEDTYKCIYELIEPGLPRITREGFGFGIGITGLLLILLAIFYKYKNKYVFFFGLITIISILLALGTPLMYLVWKFIPGFASHRYPHRALFMFAFSCSILSGFGANILLEKIKKHKKIIFAAVVLLILFNLCVLGYDTPKMRDFNEEAGNNKVYNYISQQPGIFRFQAYEIFGITRGPSYITIPLNMEFIYGYEPLWDIEYMPVYLSVANIIPSRFFGILNVKYLTSRTELNISGFKFIKEFEPNPCITNELVNQTWLYENEQYLPRAFLVDNAVLVIGEKALEKAAVKKEIAKSTTYVSMLNKNFNPRNTVIITGKKGSLGNYDYDFLKRFDFILLTENIQNINEEMLLRRYVSEGGIILPNILEGQYEITIDEISEIFKTFKGDLTPLTMEVESFDRLKINLDKNHTGFLVLSEKFALYNWNAYLNGKEIELLRADGIITAILLDNESGELVFEYKPKSFTNGMIISAITLILIIGFFVFEIWRNKNETKQ